MNKLTESLELCGKTAYAYVRNQVKYIGKNKELYKI